MEKKPKTSDIQTNFTTAIFVCYSIKKFELLILWTKTKFKGVVPEIINT